MAKASKEGFKTVTEKYCPVVGHNVTVEVTRFGAAETGLKCLFGHTCKVANGECKNSFFSSEN